MWMVVWTGIQDHDSDIFKINASGAQLPYKRREAIGESLFPAEQTRNGEFMRNIFFLMVFLWTNIPSEVFAKEKAEVVLKKGGCRGYFIADGPRGLYLLEWYGGYDPSVGDAIVGEIGSFGMKDVYYPNRNQSGRVYVDDYLLSRSRALEKYQEKCR